MSTNIEFCLNRRKAERTAFVKVLKAVPQDKRDYRHEPKARTAAELAWLIATEESALLKLLQAGDIEWKEVPPPSSMEEIVSVFERDAALVDAQLATVDDAAWKKPGRFLMDGAPVWEDEVGNMFWGFLFDAIHHRGQLSTYLRPMGSKVPAIYGPSGDENQ